MNYLSPPEIAARYGIPLRTVQAACSTGAVRATRFGRMWAVRPQDAEDFAAHWKPHTRTD